jgi:stage II sporulation protein P
MPFNKYASFRVARGLRHYAPKKRNNRNRIILILIILFLLLPVILVVPSLVDSLGFFFSQTWLAVNTAHDYPYAFFLRWTLPGMEKEKKAINIEPLLDYSNLLLDSQLVGLAALHSVPQEEDPQESDAEEAVSDEFENSLQNEQITPREVVSYLGETEPQNPREQPLQIKEKGPLILIYHTHATESFVPESGAAFTQNLNQTVVALGALLARILENEYGIPVLHHKGVYDLPRNYAYEKARPELERLLKENPQIQVVIDLHRDGVARRVTTASLNGLETGRLLFVLGTRHQGWNSNLRFYYFLQGFLEESYPGLSRGLLKNDFVYNQHLHDRSLIVEVGGHENSMEEVKRSIPYLAKAIARVFDIEDPLE